MPWHLDRVNRKHSVISMCTPYARDPSLQRWNALRHHNFPKEESCGEVPGE